MKKTWKIGLLSSVLLTPAAVVVAENPDEIIETDNTTTSISAEQQKAIKYFASLNMSSSMTDYKLYETILNDAFANDSKMYTLLKTKLDYIKSYNEQKLLADNLKTEISKLTLTNKTLIKNYEEADEKYQLLLNNIYKLNSDLAKAELDAKSELPAFEAILPENSGGLLGNLKAYYEKLTPEIVAGLIGSNNQNLLSLRGTQIANINKKAGVNDLSYLDLVAALYNATALDQYETNITAANNKYKMFTADEKTIADNQYVAGTTVTIKQAMTTANENVAKAKGFDQTVSSFATIDPTQTEQLKTLLIAIDKAFNALTPFQKQLINAESNDIIEPFEAILAVSAQIGTLKPNNTNEYRTAVDTLTKAIEALGDININDEKTIEAKSIVPNIEVYNNAITDIDAVKAVEAELLALIGTEAPTPTKEQIDTVREAFNKLTPDQRKITLHSSLLTDWGETEKNAAAIDKKIMAIVISAKSDFYKRYKAAQDAYDELDKAIATIYVTKKERLETLAPYAELVNAFNQLKITDVEYTKQLELLLNGLKRLLEKETYKGLSEEEKLQLNVAMKVITSQGGATEIANKLVGDIAKLETLAKGNPSELIATVITYREIYNGLDSTAKKLVTNIKTLTEYEKANKKALAVMKQVDNLNALDSKFVKSAVAARKAYDKLSANLQPLIADSYEKLEKLEKISNVMLEIDNLKKSRNILEDTGAAEKKYAELIEYLTKEGGKEDVIKVLEASYAPELALAKNRHEAVSDLVNQINQLKLNFTPDIDVLIESIALGYKGLTSSDKKLVGNYKDFKNIEKNYKAAAKVIRLIEDLPEKESSDYTKKVEAALKAYLKLNSDQTKYVHNYDKDLKPFIGVASLIGEIDQLKPSMKDFATIVTGLRSDYDKLSEAEKAQIHNYQKLVAAEKALEGPSKVMELIQEARPGINNYLDALQAARNAYEALNSDQKKQVTNYKELQNREKAVKPVLSLNDLILKIGMQKSAKNFISNYEKAWKELEKISLQDRAILTNEKLLTETYVPLYNVMDRIESIKSSSKTFVDDVKAARDAFNALTADQKKQILNENLLKEHEVNVQGGAYVDELIRALKSNPAAEYVQKVQEAEEAYKKLSSANKKAVTLYEELKVELKYIAPVIQAIQAIDLLETSGGKLDAQVKKVNSILAKLTDEQYTLIPNMAKYNNLGNVIQVVSLIELIKPSDTKYYIGNTKAAEIAYNRLSPTEKQKVTNYSKLEDALLNVAALDQITKKISELSNLSSTYVDDVNHLLDEYKKLPSALKKQVSNYGKLQQAEKDVDAADKVIRAIVEIDPGVRTFESKVLSARKAYDKLTDDQKTLVSNTRLLLQYERELGL